MNINLRNIVIYCSILRLLLYIVSPAECLLKVAQPVHMHETTREQKTDSDYS